MALDPKAPLVYYNLALLAFLREKKEDSAELLHRARELGLRGDLSDRAAQQGQTILARMEGRCPHTSPRSKGPA